MYLLFQETKVERKRKSRRTHSPSTSRVSNPVESLKKQKTDKRGNFMVESVMLVYRIHMYHTVAKYIRIAIIMYVCML